MGRIVLLKQTLWKKNSNSKQVCWKRVKNEQYLKSTYWSKFLWVELDSLSYLSGISLSLSVDLTWITLIEAKHPRRHVYILELIISGSVQFSRSVVSDSLQPHELAPCPSPTPEVHSNSRPSSPWCHPANSSSVAPFSSCPQSLPASGSFPMSWLVTAGGQNIGVSASVSVLPMNI